MNRFPEVLSPEDIWCDIKHIYRNSINQIHSDHGPAIIYVNGDYEYYQNGWLHRTDGPAIVYKNYFEWWINGNHYTDEIMNWMQENDVTYPFTDEHLSLFQLRWL